MGRSTAARPAVPLPPAAPPGQVLPCTEDPDLFFAEDIVLEQKARGLCRSCPVRQECLEGAVTRREYGGVWGGELFYRGVIVFCRRPRGRPPGTGGQVPPAGERAAQACGNDDDGARRSCA